MVEQLEGLPFTATGGRFYTAVHRQLRRCVDPRVHERLRATHVWDADPQALARTLAAYPQLQAAASAEALLATPGLHSAYIATPPVVHLELAHRAFDAGLAVLCEKPLTVDFAAAGRCMRLSTAGLPCWKGTSR